MDKLATYINEIESQLSSESDLVSPERKSVLRPAADFIKEKASANQKADLIFICTHNSRRSHLGQVWAHVAAQKYSLDQIHTFSGGTEATACNPRTVAALHRSGLQIDCQSNDSENSNPHYLLTLPGDATNGLDLYSKKFGDVANPQTDFVAMMCCDDVDQRCPVVPGAALRVPLHYRDPKESDDTAAESKTYDERCREIAIEMFWVMKEAAS